MAKRKGSKASDLNPYSSSKQKISHSVDTDPNNGSGLPGMQNIPEPSGVQSAESINPGLSGGASVPSGSASTANMFDDLDVKDEDIGAAVESLNGGGDYVLRLSVAPVLGCPSGDNNGPMQRSVVIVVRFQKSFTNVDCWCVKPGYIIDSIQAFQHLPQIPKIGWGEFFGSLREYPLREVAHGPSVPLTRSTRNGGRFETRVLAGFIPLNSKLDHKAVVASIGQQLSDFLSDLFFIV